jgi:hypothetical protein
MQRVVIQQATFTQIQTGVTRVLPGHDASVDAQAVNDDIYNDDIYHDEESPIRLVFSVLANVIGGALLLSGMFYLPHVIAKLLS